jgi:hypothetical protein
MPVVQNKDYSTHFKDVSTQLSIVVGSNGSADPLIAGTAGWVIVVRRIFVDVTTSAAQSFIFRTNNATPVVLLTIAASAVVGPYEAEYSQEGGEGYVLPAGEDLDLLMGGAGPAGIVIVEAHKRLAANTPVTAAAFAAAT